MLNLIISPMYRADGPPCRECGAKTRLFGTENHPLIGQLRVLSYVCVDCDAVRVDMAPLPRARGELSLHRKEAAMPMPNFSVVALLTQRQRAYWALLSIKRGRPCKPLEALLPTRNMLPQPVRYWQSTSSQRVTGATEISTNWSRKPSLF